MNPRLYHPGVADHVGVGEVDDDEIVVLEATIDFEGEVGTAHLRFVVVGGHLLGADREISVLPGIGLLDTAIEEERHMRIFLRLRGAELGETSFTDHFTQDVFKRLRPEDDRAGIALIVAGEGDVVDLRHHLPIESGEG